MKRDSAWEAAGFRVWGRVEQMAPTEFFVIASAVPEEGHEGAMVASGAGSSLAEAIQKRDELMKYMGLLVRRSGGRVVDVEEG